MGESLTSYTSISSSSFSLLSLDLDVWAFVSGSFSSAVDSSSEKSTSPMNIENRSYEKSDGFAKDAPSFLVDNFLSVPVFNFKAF